MMWSYQYILQRADAMLIYWAAIVHATPAYNIYNVYIFDKYVLITVILPMWSENSLL